MQVDFDENVIDYRRIINKMQEVGYGGWFGVEFVWTAIWNCNQVDNTAETIRFRDLAQPSSTAPSTCRSCTRSSGEPARHRITGRLAGPAGGLSCLD